MPIPGSSWTERRSIRLAARVRTNDSIKRTLIRSAATSRLAQASLPMKRQSTFVMPKILIASLLTLSVLASGHAAAFGESDAMAPVHQFIDGFNRNDLGSAIAACADEASVIDDFPPHEWQGAGCGKWADGFRAIAEKEGITDARILPGKPRHVDVTGDWAYVVVPVTLVFRHLGKVSRLPSLFTASLHKQSNGWRITGWAWADL